ncbi:Hypp7619 [Branchiostoma lanceolatum]|uniref:Hypp7619 protein n=1 Tax=Branchiostoma lanceolatum TaxID=7740 RepID=A0A8J9Z2G3_BRALA|nr:Hypp7619 [Branchiostoma lanceolatum]
MWVMLRPRRLPRKISSIIVCVVYAPPLCSYEDTLRQHLIETVDKLRTQYDNAGYFIMGDFNHVDISAVCSGNGLHQVVNVPTRYEATLDLILTNLNDFYHPPTATSPLGRGDHNIVLLKPKHQLVTNKTTKRETRPMTESNLRSFGQWITQYQWDDVLEAQGTQNKTSTFYRILTQAIDTHFPSKVVKTHAQDKPWISPVIKNAIKLRQRAFEEQDWATWRTLRNKVQRAIKRAKSEFYRNRVQKLKKENPRA